MVASAGVVPAMRSLWGDLARDAAQRQTAYALVAITFEVAVMTAPARAARRGRMRTVFAVLVTFGVAVGVVLGNALGGTLVDAASGAVCAYARRRTLVHSASS